MDLVLFDSITRLPNFLIGMFEKDLNAIGMETVYAESIT